jgi:hypothetical protein
MALNVERYAVTAATTPEAPPVLRTITFGGPVDHPAMDPGSRTANRTPTAVSGQVCLAHRVPDSEVLASINASLLTMLREFPLANILLVRSGAPCQPDDVQPLSQGLADPSCGMLTLECTELRSEPAAGTPAPDVQLRLVHLCMAALSGLMVRHIGVFDERLGPYAMTDFLMRARSRGWLVSRRWWNSEICTGQCRCLDGPAERRGRYYLEGKWNGFEFEALSRELFMDRAIEPAAQPVTRPDNAATSDPPALLSVPAAARSQDSMPPVVSHSDESCQCQA